jgi:hypothetical protein
MRTPKIMTLVSALSCAALLFSPACGGEAAKKEEPKADAAKADDAKAGDAKAGETKAGDAKAAAPEAEAPKADAPAAAVEVPEPMKNFLAKFDGTDAAVGAALKEFGKEGLEDADMSLYMLKDPKATAVNGDCVTFEAAAGITTRKYTVCWKDGKIDSVKDEDATEED